MVLGAERGVAVLCAVLLSLLCCERLVAFALCGGVKIRYIVKSSVVILVRVVLLSITYALGLQCAELCSVTDSGYAVFWRRVLCFMCMYLFFHLVF